MPAFTRFAWTVLVVNLAVVAWGAFVRATGSGAGCGRHWPTCNGEVLPRDPGVATAIEFTHRVSSGVALLLVIALAVWAVRAFARRHPARRAAWAALVLIIVESLVGASLVLFGWVAKDASPERGWVMAIHLTNTFLLLAALTLVAAWSRRPGLELEGRAPFLAALAVALGTVLLTGVTGAIAALGDTLFPATSFVEGLRDETAPGAALLLRLRVLHPFAAITAGAALLAAARLALRSRPGERVRRAGLAVIALVGIEIVVGGANVLLLAPIWLQVVHLLLADAVWIAVVLLGAAALAPEAVPAQGKAPVRATG